LNFTITRNFGVHEYRVQIIGGPSRLIRMASGATELIELIGPEWYGWPCFRCDIASNLYELDAGEKIVQRVLRRAEAHEPRIATSKLLSRSVCGDEDEEDRNDFGRY
jgi:hypothetical protein